MRRSVALAVGLGVVSLATSVLGVTNEPNTVQVPLDSKNGEVQLYTLFQQRNDPVDWLADAHTTPATFSPLCNFKATFVLHEAGADRGVGWYNADPNATTAPAASDIHVVVPAGTAVGTVISSATIKGDPAYKGGLIGFALVDGQTHYSEQQWNVQCAPIFCANPGPWILSVTYQSKSVPNAYYLAFEDGSVDTFSFGNDGDFNDDVFFFEGLTCQGGGTPCSTGQPGVCADGLNECSVNGLECKAIVKPQPEKCDGVDNDCNGKTDEGDLCQAGFVCDHGKCVARCGTSEFQCDEVLVCNTDGFCVDQACATVSCPEGTVCQGGACKAPCDGVVCPEPTVCRAGVCADPCAGVECEVGSFCDRGICTPGCDCNPCATGLACDTASKLCVEPACVGVTCATGTRCSGGTCVDPCASAVCPAGQACQFGECIPGTHVDAGAGGDTGAGGTVFAFADAGSPGPIGAGGISGGSGGAITFDGTGGSPAAASAPLGCGCRMVGNEDSGRGTVLVAALALVLSGRRRRR